MKKIGCVIAYRKGHTNYGTALVGFALVKKIEQLGFCVEIINYVKKLSLKQKLSFILNAIRSGEFKSLVAIVNGKWNLKRKPLYAKCIEERTKAVEAYKERKIIPLFRTFVGYKALHEGSKEYDSIVVGSDQVWTPMSLPNKFFNLLFVDDSVRKIAYGSSFGVSSIPDFQKKATGAYLDRFYKIGVREQKGKEIVDSLSHQTAHVVADPTMLISAEEWKKEFISENSEKIIEPYIFCYFLGTNQEARRAAVELKGKTGYKIIALLHMDEFVPEDEAFGDETPYNIDPNGFLRLIYEASYICTDSFHCSAFCIQFHKPFMTFYRFAHDSSTSRNSRIDSLFNILDVSKNHIYSGNIEKIDAPIDWNEVDAKLSKYRDDSIKFLKESLNGL